MSHIAVHRIDDVAKLRLARTAQINALPPQIPRHVGTHWDLNRIIFVHGFYKGASRFRLSSGTLEQLLAAEAAAAAGMSEEEIAALSLEELLVLPEVISELTSAIGDLIAGIPPPPPAPPTGIPGQYTMLDTGGVAHVSTSVYSAAGGGQYQNSNVAMVPGPVFLESVSVVWSAELGTVATYSVTIDGIGVIASGSQRALFNTSHPTQLNLGRILLKNAGAMRVNVMAVGNADDDLESTLSASVAYHHAVQS